MNDLYAHTPNDKGKWHGLSAHLEEVASYAKQFADKFHAGDLAYWIALWHDLGKAILNFKTTSKRAGAMKDMKKFRMQYGARSWRIGYSVIIKKMIAGKK